MGLINASGQYSRRPVVQPNVAERGVLRGSLGDATDQLLMPVSASWRSFWYNSTLTVTSPPPQRFLLDQFLWVQVLISFTTGMAMNGMT
jgi:hypothetical protein